MGPSVTHPHAHAHTTPPPPPPQGFDVNKVGDARVGFVGFPSVGKSTLLTKLTGTYSEVRGRSSVGGGSARAVSNALEDVGCLPGVGGRAGRAAVGAVQLPLSSRTTRPRLA